MNDRVPFGVRQIDHLVLRVAQLERSITFYGAVLGCTVARRRDDLGLVHLRAGDCLIDLVSLDGPLGRKGGAGAAAEGRNLDHFCLRIAPFDPPAIEAHLARLHISMAGPAQSRFGAEGEGPSLYLSDPDGNAIELRGTAPPGAGTTEAAAADGNGSSLLALVGQRGSAAVDTEGACASALDGAVACLSRFTAAFNRGDADAVDRELHFPHLLLGVEHTVSWERPGQHPHNFFSDLRATGWHHTRYRAVDPVLVAPDKVHLRVAYERRRADGSVLSFHENVWIVCLRAGRWGIVLRSY